MTCIDLFRTCCDRSNFLYIQPPNPPINTHTHTHQLGQNIYGNESILQPQQFTSKSLVDSTRFPRPGYFHSYPEGASIMKDICVPALDPCSTPQPSYPWAHSASPCVWSPSLGASSMLSVLEPHNTWPQCYCTFNTLCLFVFILFNALNLWACEITRKERASCLIFLFLTEAGAH